MALTPTYSATMDLVDHAAKHSAFSVPIASADFTAFIADNTTGKVKDIFAAVAGLTLDVVTGESVQEEAAVAVSILPPPTSEGAVNSAKLIVLYRDTVTAEPYSRTIPARNPAAYISTRGFVSLAAAGSGGTAQIVAFVTAFEAGVLSEDGNAVKIIQIRVVGRGTAA